MTFVSREINNFFYNLIPFRGPSVRKLTNILHYEAFVFAKPIHLIYSSPETIAHHGHRGSNMRWSKVIFIFRFNYDLILKMRVSLKNV